MPNWLDHGHVETVPVHADCRISLECTKCKCSADPKAAWSVSTDEKYTACSLKCAHELAAGHDQAVITPFGLARSRSDRHPLGARDMGITSELVGCTIESADGPEIVVTEEYLATPALYPST